MTIDAQIGSIIDEETGYTAKDLLLKGNQIDQQAENDEVLLAGLGNIAPGLRRITRKRNITKLFEHVATRKRETPLDPEEVYKSFDILKEYSFTPDPTGRRSEYASTNLGKVHQGAFDNIKELAEMDPSEAIGMMNTANDIGRMLEAVGKVEDLSFKKAPHAEIAKKTENIEQSTQFLEPFLSKERPKGMLMDKYAIHAGRRMIATIGEDVTQIANEIVAGNATAELLLEYQKKSKAFIAMQKFMEGEVREVARALSQQNMIAKSLDSRNANIMMQAIESSFGDPAKMIKHAKMLVKESGKSGSVNAVKKMNSRRILDSAIGFGVEWWKASILSGPATHIVNVGSTGLLGLYESMLVKPAAAGVGAVRQRIVRLAGATPQEKITATEAFAGAMSGMTSITDALRAAKQTLIEGESHFGMGKTEAVKKGGYVPDMLGALGKKIGGQQGETLGNVAGTGFTVAYRLLEAEDEFFKTIAFNEEITRLATRKAINDPANAGKSFDEIMGAARLIMDDPPDELFDQAIQYAKKRTFTDQDYGGLIGAMSAGAKMVVRKAPLLSFILPFINTPSSLANYAIESTPLNMYHVLKTAIKKGGPEADEAIARMLVGSSVMAGAYFAYESGAITGQGPNNIEVRKALEKTGWRANAILLNGTYYQINRLDPMGKVIGMVADSLDKAKYSKDMNGVQDHVMNGVFSLSEQMLDATYMKGVSDLLDAINYQGNPAVRFLANYGKAFIPWSGTVKTMTDIVDPQQRRIDKLWKTPFFSHTWHRTLAEIKNNIPIMVGKQLRPARYWDGTIALPGMNRIAYAISPMKYGKAQKGDYANQVMIANNYAPGEPNHIITVGDLTFSLMDFDENAGLMYDEYIKEVGAQRRQTMNDLLKKKAFNKLPDGIDSEKSEIIRSSIEKADRVARKNFLYKTLPSLLLNYEGSDSLLREILADSNMDVERFVKDVNRGLVTEEMAGGRIKVKGIKEEDELLPAHLRP